MTFFAIIIALLIAYRTPQHAHATAQAFNTYARWLEQKLYAGERKHVLIAWGAGVLLPVLIVAMLSVVARHIHASFTLILSVATLYLCLQNTPLLFLGDPKKPEEEASAVVHHFLIKTFVGVLAPIIWFILLGPAGALLYRLSASFSYIWTASQQASMLRVAFDVMNWLPSRICAGSFAIVADFEDAVYCWREQSSQFQDRSLGILLSSGAGALGIKLTAKLPTHNEINSPAEIGLGEPADQDSIKSTIGMIWRVLILIVAVVLLLTLASWMG